MELGQRLLEEVGKVGLLDSGAPEAARGIRARAGLNDGAEAR